MTGTQPLIKIEQIGYGQAQPSLKMRCFCSNELATLFRRELPARHPLPAKPC